jgi:hypothetical protein
MGRKGNKKTEKAQTNIACGLNGVHDNHKVPTEPELPQPRQFASVANGKVSGGILISSRVDVTLVQSCAQSTKYFRLDDPVPLIMKRYGV